MRARKKVRLHRASAEQVRNWRRDAMKAAREAARDARACYLDALAMGQVAEAREWKQREQFYTMRYTRLWRMLQ